MADRERVTTTLLGPDSEEVQTTELPQPLNLSLSQQVAAEALIAPHVPTPDLEGSGLDYATDLSGARGTETVSRFSSLADGMTDFGMITGGLRTIGGTPVSNHIDSTATLDRYFENNPEDLKVIQPYLDDVDRGQPIINLLIESRNDEETRALIEKVRVAEEHIKSAQQNPGFYATGAVLGLGLDVVGSIGIIAATGGGAFPLVAVNTARAQRVIAASRLGVLAGAEAGAERLIQAQSQPFITGEEILESAGIGVAVGAALGFAFPNVMGRIRRLEADMEPRTATADMLDEMQRIRHTGDSTAGAMRTPEALKKDLVLVPERHAGTLIVSKLAKIPYLGKVFGPHVIRSPKRVTADIGVEGDKAFAEQGLTGGRVFYDRMSRVFSMGVVNKSEARQHIARPPSIVEFTDQLKALRMGREMDVREEYYEAVADVFEQGKPESYFISTSETARKTFGKGDITQEAYEMMADELAIMRGNPRTKDLGLEYIPDEILQRLAPEKVAKLRKHLENTATKEDAYYQAVGRQEVEMGLLDEADLIPGYRPQRWDATAIIANQRVFDNLIRNVISKNPEEEWVRANIQIKDEDGNLRSILDEGESWDAFAKRDPEMAEEIVDEWSAGIRNDLESDLFEATTRYEDELNKLRVGQKDDIMASMERRQRLDSALIDRLEKQMAEARAEGVDVADLDRMAKRIANAEARFFDSEMRLTSFRNAKGDMDELDRLLRKFGSAKQTFALGKAARKVDAAVRKEARASAQKLANEIVDDIRDAILSGKNPYSHIDPKDLKGSARFKRRSLDMREFRHTPEGREFLKLSTYNNRAAYEHSTSPPLAMKQAFGIGADRKTIAQETLQGYDDDLVKATDPKLRKRIIQERDLADQIVNETLDEITHAKMMNQTDWEMSTRALASATATATAASALGTVIAANMGDVIMANVAGGRMGVGLKGMMRTAKMRKIFKEIADDKPTMAILLRGANVVDGGRFRAFAGLDDRLGFDVAGGKFGTVTRITDKTAVIEGWANMMTPWNKTVRGTFGMSFAHQINGDIAEGLANYNKLSTSLKTYYAKIGFDSNDIEAITDLMRRESDLDSTGYLRIPREDAWARENPELLRKYRMALQRAGDEAMLSPGVGDRPFLNSSPVGQLVLQFQGFMFTASDRFIGPMIQDALIHPNTVKPWAGMMTALMIGVLVDGMKASMHGRLDQWADDWDTEEGVRDNIWGAVVRSPLMGGPLSMLTDQAMTHFGAMANNATEGLGGPRMFREAPNKFRNSGGWALLGPSANIVFGSGFQMKDQLARGDFQAFQDSAARRVPVLNTFWAQYFKRLMENQ